MEPVKQVVEVDSLPWREVKGNYCLLPYLSFFADCDDEQDELIVKVIAIEIRHPEFEL